MRIIGQQIKKLLIPQDFLQKAGPFISAKYGHTFGLADFANLENRDTSNPHEAIRPTHIDTENIVTEDAKVAGLYRLIWRTTVESCMRAAKYNCYKLTIAAPLDSKFTCTLEIPTFLGWKVVNKKTDEPDYSKTLFYIQSLAKAADGKTPVQYCSISTSLTVSNTHSHYTEASLISKLEGLGIGRPSTFASLVETIIERGYVAKTNVEGKPIACDEYILKNGEITKDYITKIFGAEKNKLIIQPIGELCVDFLTEHFESLFEYEYTKKMEDTLDEISRTIDTNKAEMDGATLCKTVDSTIKSYIKLADKIEKQAYALSSSGYEYIFTKFGGSIRSTRPIDSPSESGYKYLPAKKDIVIDLAKLKRGEYTLDELLETPNTLGELDGVAIYLKHGQYGHYLEWNGTKHSYAGNPKTISLDEAIGIFQRKTESQTNDNDNNVSTSSTFIIRKLSDICSIRRGKYGPYIYYMSTGAKKPEFYNLKKFKEDFTQCDIAHLVEWVNKTHKVSLKI